MTKFNNETAKGLLSHFITKLKDDVLWVLCHSFEAFVHNEEEKLEQYDIDVAEGKAIDMKAYYTQIGYTKGLTDAKQFISSMREIKWSEEEIDNQD